MSGSSFNQALMASKVSSFLASLPRFLAKTPRHRVVRGETCSEGSTRVDQADEEGALDHVCGPVRRRSSSAVFAPVTNFLRFVAGSDFDFAFDLRLEAIQVGEVRAAMAWGIVQSVITTVHWQWHSFFTMK